MDFIQRREKKRLRQRLERLNKDLMKYSKNSYAVIRRRTTLEKIKAIENKLYRFD